MSLSQTTAIWAPALALAAGLALALWSVYSDYLRRRPPGSTSGTPERRGPAPIDEGQGSMAGRWRTDSLTLGLAFLGLGGGIYFLFRGRAPGAAAVGYLPVAVGIAFLAAYLSRHARIDSRGGGENAGENENVGGSTSSLPAGRRPLP